MILTGKEGMSSMTLEFEVVMELKTKERLFCMLATFINEHTNSTGGISIHPAVNFQFQELKAIL